MLLATWPNLTLTGVTRRPDRRLWRPISGLTLRVAAMGSPDRPEVNQRLTQQAFWQQIAAGLQNDDAARVCGVSQLLGPRWFREAGAIAPTTLNATSGSYLGFAEREEISLLHAQQLSVREIARRLERAPSTISRKLRRNAATRSGSLQYRASVAQWRAERAAQRPKVVKLARNDKFESLAHERLAGTLRDVRGEQLPSPQVPWNGRRHGHRADRRWGNSWSPRQISRRLTLDLPDDSSMRVSHEAIYHALYIQGRGDLKRELTACLRTGRSLRAPQAKTRQRGKQFITCKLLISERPAEIAERAVPGHWEGDLIIGLNSSAIETLGELTARFTMLLHLPPMPGHAAAARVKNGPALAGYGAEAVRKAIVAKIATLPHLLGKSLTWDQGAELAQHVQLRIETGLKIYFCDPRSPWQRGSNAGATRIRTDCCANTFPRAQT